MDPLGHQMTIDLAVPPDREFLVASLMFEREQWAEINQEKGYLELELYSRRDGAPWRFELSQALDALQQARKRLEDR